MSALGDLEPLELIIHTDPQWERYETRVIRSWYQTWLQDHGIETHILPTGNIRTQGAFNHIHMPFWTVDAAGNRRAHLRRQCSREYKIRPTRRFLRARAGYHPSKAPNPPAALYEQWIGISLDEANRRKASRVQYITARWPLVELRMTRHDCIRYLENHDLPVPIKSACIGCPFRPASEWLQMRETSPDEWHEACEFDNAIRHNPLAARVGNEGSSTADRLFVYRHAVPLAEADLATDATRERPGRQLPLLVPEIH